MLRLVGFLILGLQIVLTFIAIFCIYMFFALYDNEFGFDGLFGLFIIQPVIAGIISVITIVLCLLAGLPIRLNKKLKHWWIKNFYIAIIGLVFGMIFLVLSIFPDFAETVVIDSGITKQVPNTMFVSTGWFLTAFSLIHLYPPISYLSGNAKSF